MIVFDSRLWHSSFGGRTGRRMFSMTFAENPVDGWQVIYLYGLVAPMPPAGGDGSTLID